jgi:hypothetical protein
MEPVREGKLGGGANSGNTSYLALRSTSIQGLSVVTVFFDPASDIYRPRSGRSPRVIVSQSGDLDALPFPVAHCVAGMPHGAAAGIGVAYLRSVVSFAVFVFRKKRAAPACQALHTSGRVAVQGHDELQRLHAKPVVSFHQVMPGT